MNNADSATDQIEPALEASKGKKIIVLGSNARQASIIWRLLASKDVERIYYIPGRSYNNARVECVDIALDSWGKLYDFYVDNDVSYIITDSGDMLATGIVDFFEEKGAKIFGPNKYCARLESSKTFAKQFMQRHGIPTASYAAFEDYDEAKAYLLAREEGPVVIKADGLVRGRGVVVCANRNEALAEIEVMMSGSKFGSAGEHVVIEEYLEGPEVSVHILIDGSNYKMFPLSQDHKPLLEGNEGPNTGGMGTYTPVPWVSDEYIKRIISEIVEPTIKGLKEEGLMYKGLLFPGLVLTERGPVVLEYNTRFGAPETQSYMMTLRSDLSELLEAVVSGRLDTIHLEWKEGYGATIEIVPENYPEELVTDSHEVTIQTSSFTGQYFLSGADKVDGALKTLGGKTLSVSAYGDSLEQALNEAYKGAANVDFEGMYYRKDIGRLNNTQVAVE